MCPYDEWQAAKTKVTPAPWPKFQASANGRQLYKGENDQTRKQNSNWEVDFDVKMKWV